MKVGVMKETAPQPVRILLVDDTPTNLAVLSESIKDQGWTTLFATDGETSIEQAEYAQPDLILLDVMMPGIDGFETCRRLKASLADSPYSNHLYDGACRRYG